MIDYLERLFVPELTGDQEPEEAAVLSGVSSTQSGPDATPIKNGIPDVEAQFWQQEAIRRLDSALSAEPGERESISIQRPDSRRESETLEHRLRRDSRRYDSGFFLY